MQRPEDVPIRPYVQRPEEAPLQRAEDVLIQRPANIQI